MTVANGSSVGYRVGDQTVYLHELERASGVVNTLDLGYRLGVADANSTIHGLTAELSTATSTIHASAGGDSPVARLVSQLEILGLDDSTYGTTYGVDSDVHLPILGHEALTTLSRAFASMNWFRCKWAGATPAEKYLTYGFVELDVTSTELYCPTPNIPQPANLDVTFDVQVGNDFIDVPFSGTSNTITFENKIIAFDAVTRKVTGQGFKEDGNHVCSFTLKNRDGTYTIPAKYVANNEIECDFPETLAQAYGDTDYGDDATVTLTVSNVDGSASFSYHGHHCTDGVINGNEDGGNKPPDCGGSCDACPSCGLTPSYACRSCVDPNRFGKAGMTHIQGLAGTANMAVWCEDGFALMAVVKKNDGCNKHFNRGAVGGPVTPDASNTRKYSDAIIRQYRTLSQNAGDQGSQVRFAFKMIADGTHRCPQRTQFCSSRCTFDAMKSINGNNQCNECGNNENGPNRINHNPNSGTRGLGHHHYWGHNRVYFAWQRHPEHGGNCGFRSDPCDSSDGILWLK